MYQELKRLLELTEENNRLLRENNRILTKLEQNISGTPQSDIKNLIMNLFADMVAGNMLSQQGK